MRSPSWLVVLVLATPAHAEPFVGRASIVDGDTLAVRGTRNRLHGIDAPESLQDCRDKRGRMYACGRDARDALADANKDLLAPDAECEADPDKLPPFLKLHQWLDLRSKPLAPDDLRALLDQPTPDTAAIVTALLRWGTEAQQQAYLHMSALFAQAENGVTATCPAAEGIH